MLADFSGHFRTIITSGGLTPPISDLRLAVNFLARVDGWETVEGILDPFVDDDQDLFEQVTIGFVSDQRVWGSNNDHSIELEFEKHLWETAISEGVRLKMVPNLEVIVDSDQLDDEDASDANRRRIAFSNARATLPADAGEDVATAT